MKKTYQFLSLLMLTVLLASCGNDGADLPDPTVRPLSASEAEIASSANNFTFDLMTQIEAEFPNENYFISSFSISTALSMVMNGASDPAQEMFIQTLGLDGMSPEAINEAYTNQESNNFLQCKMRE